MSSFDQELGLSIPDVEKQINALANYSAADVRERLVKIEQKVKQLSTTLHHLQTEVRNTEDRKLQAQLTTAAANHDRKIKEIKNRIKEVKDRMQGGGAGAAAAAAAGGPGSPFDPSAPRNDGKDAARSKAATIDQLQTQALASVKRTIGTVEETKAIGDEAVTTLRKQTEQLTRMNDKLDNLESEVQRGKKELNAFIRRMMTDKILLCFLFLIVVGIIVVVVLKVKNPFEPDQPRAVSTTTTVAPASTAAPGGTTAKPPALSNSFLRR